MNNFKGRTIVGLIMVYVAIFMNWQWLWGILFLLWVLPDLWTGITYFMEPIEKKSNPMLYWIIIGSWLWMSAYTIASPFFPQLQTVSIGQPAYKAVATGNYEPTTTQEKNTIFSPQKTTQVKSIPTNTANTKKPAIATDNPKTTTPKKIAQEPATKKVGNDLQYKTYQQPTTKHFVGMEVTLNSSDPDLEKHTTELWDYFYKNDISSAIPNIVDSKIYVVYYDYDQPNQGDYKMMIGFQTKDVNNIYEGLAGVSIPTTKFAVFEQNGGTTENFIATTWEKIINSDLAVVNSYSIEAYELDDNYKTKSATLSIAIK